MHRRMAGYERPGERPNGGLWPWRFRLDWRKQSAFVPAVSRRWLAGGGIGGRQRQRPPRSPSQLIPQTYLLSPPASPSLSVSAARLHGWLNDWAFRTRNTSALFTQQTSIQSVGEGERDRPRSHGGGVGGGAAGLAAVLVGVGSDAGAVRHDVRDVGLLVRRVEEVRHGPGGEDAHVRSAVRLGAPWGRCALDRLHVEQFISYGGNTSNPCSKCSCYVFQ